MLRHSEGRNGRWLLLVTAYILIAAGWAKQVEAVPNEGVELADEVIVHIPLDEPTRTLHAYGPKQVWAGTYYPTDDPDHDTNETTRFDRYRVEGRFGRGLRFFAQDHSYGQLQGFELPSQTPRLVVSAFVKMDSRQIGDLVNCRMDTGKGGFALMVWGNHLRFQYGDGKTAYTIDSADVALAGGRWHHVEVVFDRGAVSFYIDGKLLSQHESKGRMIGRNRHALTLGAYPVRSGGRRPYSFDGTLDEVIVARSRDAVHHLLRQVSKTHDSEWAFDERLATLTATVQPVEGNEPHFGGSVFHNVRGRPVPLTFLFRGKAEEIEHAALVLYLREGEAVVREMMGGSRNRDDLLVETKQELVEQDDQIWVRYETVNYDLAKGLGLQYSASDVSPAITVALSGKTKETTVRWALVLNGEEYGGGSFTMRMLDPMSVPENPGRFEILSYLPAAEMAYHDLTLQQAIADLYLSSNIRAKGRFYPTHTARRRAFDEYLLTRGFQLDHINLWAGPLLSGLGDADPPKAVTANGKPHKRYNCPTRLLNDESLCDVYRQHVATRLRLAEDGDWVVLDYEPWGATAKICFCEYCIDAFAEQFKIDGELTPEHIRSDYQRQWIAFWVQHSERATRLMHDAIKAVNETLRVREYTYFFNYEDEESLWRRFYSIPKDPRRHEPYVDEFLLSAYHINDRELFDAVSMSLRHLTNVAVIGSLSRANEVQGGYTPPEESLSPQRMYQKNVMLAALGVRRYGLWPGTMIDGRFHEVMGKASRLIWAHEEFYYDGQRAENLVDILSDARRDDFAYTVWRRADGAVLLSIFNFREEPIVVDVRWNDQTTFANVTDHEGKRYSSRSQSTDITVAAHGVLLLKAEPGGS